MRTTLIASVAALLLFAGCATDDAPAPVEVTDTVTSSETSSPDPTPEPAPEPEPEPAPAPEPVPEPAAAPAPAVQQAPIQPVAPTFVSCYLADGTALMSDGTHQYMDTCNESAGGPMVLEDGTSIYENHPNLPEPAPTLRPGWHCDGPAYMCRDDAASGKTSGQAGQ